MFFPYKETMGTEELAQLYFNMVFPHYGVPTKIISNRDLQLTSKLAKEICQEAKQGSIRISVLLTILKQLGNQRGPIRP